MLVKLSDEHSELTRRVARRLMDSRRKKSGDHSLLDMLRQRVYAIALGYEDLNDHDCLRKDVALQTAVGRDTALASKSTLCSFENQ